MGESDKCVESQGALGLEVLKLDFCEVRPFAEFSVGDFVFDLDIQDSFVPFFIIFHLVSPRFLPLMGMAAFFPQFQL